MRSKKPNPLGRLLTAAFVSIGLAFTGLVANAYQTTGLLVYVDGGNSSSYNAATSTTAWNDLSVNNRHGTIVNPNLVSLSNGALTFSNGSPFVYTSNDSRTAFVDFPDGFADFGTGITIEVEAQLGSNVGNWERIFDFGNGPGNNNFWLGRYGNSSDLALEVWQGGTNRGRCKTDEAVSAIPANHALKKFTLTLDGTTCRIYVNGVEVDTEVDAGNGSFVNSSGNLSSSYAFLPNNITRTNNFIGKSNWGGDAAFEGAVKYLRIYSTALSSQSVQNNSNTSTPSKTITYSRDGSDVGGSVPAPFVGSGAVTLSSNTGNLAKSGNQFIGWATTANQTTAISNSFNLTQDVTLFPVFEALVSPGQTGTPTATIIDTTASIAWTAPTTGATPFTYAVTSNPAGGTCTVSGLSASCTGLTPGTNYTFSVVATNSVGSSSPSSASNSVTATAPVVAPGQTGTPTATISNTTASVSWTAPTSGTAPFTYAATSNPAGGSCTIASLTATCTGLTPGTSYTFSVVATNSAGSSSSSSASNSVTASAVPVQQNSGGNSAPPIPALQVVRPVGPNSQVSPPATNVQPGGTHTLLGIGLDTVSTVKIGNLESVISQKSRNELSLKIPTGLPAGKYKIELLGPFGTIAQENFFEVPRMQFSISATGFTPDKSLVKKAIRSRIENSVGRLNGVLRVVCTGSTSGIFPTQFSRQLARERARAACELVKSRNPEITTSIMVTPAAGLGSKFRSVNLAYFNH